MLLLVPTIVPDRERLAVRSSGRCGLSSGLPSGATPGIAAAAIRTLLRLIDGLFSYAVAFVTVLVSGKRQRLGDMAARTLVVRV